MGNRDRKSIEETAYQDMLDVLKKQYEGDIEGYTNAVAVLQKQWKNENEAAKPPKNEKPKQSKKKIEATKPQKKQSQDAKPNAPVAPTVETKASHEDVVQEHTFEDSMQEHIKHGEDLRESLNQVIKKGQYRVEDPDIQKLGNDKLWKEYQEEQKQFLAEEKRLKELYGADKVTEYKENYNNNQQLEQEAAVKPIDKEKNPRYDESFHQSYQSNIQEGVDDIKQKMKEEYKQNKLRPKPVVNKEEQFNEINKQLVANLNENKESLQNDSDYRKINLANAIADFIDGKCDDKAKEEWAEYTLGGLSEDQDIADYVIDKNYSSPEEFIFQLELNSLIDKSGIKEGKELEFKEFVNSNKQWVNKGSLENLLNSKLDGEAISALVEKYQQMSVEEIKSQNKPENKYESFQGEIESLQGNASGNKDNVLVAVSKFTDTLSEDKIDEWAKYTFGDLSKVKGESTADRIVNCLYDKNYDNNYFAEELIFHLKLNSLIDPKTNKIKQDKELEFKDFVDDKQNKQWIDKKTYKKLLNNQLNGKKISKLVEEYKKSNRKKIESLKKKPKDKSKPRKESKISQLVDSGRRKVKSLKHKLKPKNKAFGPDMSHYERLGKEWEEYAQKYGPKAVAQYEKINKSLQDKINIFVQEDDISNVDNENNLANVVKTFVDKSHIQNIDNWAEYTFGDLSKVEGDTIGDKVKSYLKDYLKDKNNPKKELIFHLKLNALINPEEKGIRKGREQEFYKLIDENKSIVGDGDKINLLNNKLKNNKITALIKKKPFAGFGERVSKKKGGIHKSHKLGGIYEKDDHPYLIKMDQEKKPNDIAEYMSLKIFEKLMPATELNPGNCCEVELVKSRGGETFIASKYIKGYKDLYKHMKNKKRSLYVSYKEREAAKNRGKEKYRKYDVNYHLQAKKDGKYIIQNLEKIAVASNIVGNKSAFQSGNLGVVKNKKDGRYYNAQTIDLGAGHRNLTEKLDPFKSVKTSLVHGRSEKNYFLRDYPEERIYNEEYLKELMEQGSMSKDVTEVINKEWKNIKNFFDKDTITKFATGHLKMTKEELQNLEPEQDVRDKIKERYVEIMESRVKSAGLDHALEVGMRVHARDGSEAVKTFLDKMQKKYKESNKEFSKRVQKMLNSPESTQYHTKYEPEEKKLISTALGLNKNIIPEVEIKNDQENVVEEKMAEPKQEELPTRSNLYKSLLRNSTNQEFGEDEDIEELYEPVEETEDLGEVEEDEEKGVDPAALSDGELDAGDDDINLQDSNEYKEEQAKVEAQKKQQSKKPKLDINGNPPQEQEEKMVIPQKQQGNDSLEQHHSGQPQQQKQKQQPKKKIRQSPQQAQRQQVQGQNVASPKRDGVPLKQKIEIIDLLNEATKDSNKTFESYISAIIKSENKNLQNFMQNDQLRESVIGVLKQQIAEGTKAGQKLYTGDDIKKLNLLCAVIASAGISKTLKPHVQKDNQNNPNKKKPPPVNLQYQQDKKKERGNKK